MRSIPAFIISTVGVAIVWALTSVVPFVLLSHSGLEQIFQPTLEQFGILLACYGGGAFFWYLLSSELAALAGRRATMGWATVQTSLVLIALPVVAHSLPLLMLKMGLLGLMGAAVWSVWFPLVLEADHRVRPSLVATFFVALYTVSAILIPVASQLLASHGTVQTVMGMGAASLATSVLVIAVSAKMLRPTRSLAPVSFLRLTRDDFADLFNLSYLFLFMFGLLLLPVLLYTSGTLLPALAERNLKFDESALSWIMAIGRVPAVAVLLVAMPNLRHAVPVRYFGMGLVVAGVGLGGAAKATNPLIFVVCLLVYFAGIGLCWSAFFDAVISAVVREARIPGLLFSGLGLVLGIAASGGLHYAAFIFDLTVVHVFLLVAAGSAGGGVLLFLGSFIAALNGANEGGHFGDEMLPQTNFGRFKYGNPRS